MKTLKAIATLLILPAVLAELISASTTITAFLHPLVLAYYIILGYGLPVLLIREFAVRNNLGFGGIYLLGIAYGIFNEGLLAKTMIVSESLPLREYDFYGVAFGISVPWSIVVSLWHALVSVLIPILITHALFPTEAGKSWLNKRLAMLLAFVILGMGCFSLLHKHRLTGTATQLFIFLFVMVGCVVASLLFKRKVASPEKVSATNIYPVFLGASVMVCFMVLASVAATKPSVALFFLILTIVVSTYIVTLKIFGWLNARSLMIFGIGCYMLSALLGMFTRTVQNSAALEALAVGVLAEIAFVAGVLIICKQSVRVDYIGRKANLRSVN